MQYPTTFVLGSFQLSSATVVGGAVVMGQSCITTLGKVFTRTCSITLYWSKNGDVLRLERWLAESNGSLLTQKSPAGWLPVHRDQLWAQHSVTSMGEVIFLTFIDNKHTDTMNTTFVSQQTGNIVVYFFSQPSDAPQGHEITGKLTSLLSNSRLHNKSQMSCRRGSCHLISTITSKTTTLQPSSHLHGLDARASWF